jgi:hypothetical protein
LLFLSSFLNIDTRQMNRNLALLLMEIAAISSCRMKEVSVPLSWPKLETSSRKIPVAPMLISTERKIADSFDRPCSTGFDGTGQP